MKIWAHRGCSQRYPENTITSFTKAAELFERGLEGIELDVQLTKDGELVVVHDERIDRTTDGFGFVRDYTLEELKTFHIHTGAAEPEYIPTLREVLELLEDQMKRGFKLNIELKNGVYPYPGLEEKTHEMVCEYGVEKSVVYSSFRASSLELMKSIAPENEIGVLDTRVSDCLYKLKGGCGADALHPFWQTIDLPPEKLTGFTVRAWLSGHLYPEKPTGGRLNIAELEAKGITDLFLNEPEVYL